MATQHSTIANPAQLPQGTSPGREALRRMCKHPLALGAAVFLTLIAILAVLTPVLPLQSPSHTNATRTLAPPAPWEMIDEGIKVLDAQGGIDERRLEVEFEELHGLNRWLFNLRLAMWGERCLSSVCGTDELGRDLLARLFWGARISLAIGLLAALVSLVIGVLYGAIAGYAGGTTDDAMMRAVDLLDSLPLMFIVIFLNTFLSEDRVRAAFAQFYIDRITLMFIVVGAVYWLTMARVVRGQIMSLKHEEFVEAAQAIGASHARIIFRHLVPNLLGIVIVYLTLTIPQVMLFEAFLSFLGLGVQDPDVSWGLLANQGFRVITPIRIFWWLVFYPGLALGMTLLALNFLGDGLRDALDPRMRDR